MGPLLAIFTAGLASVIFGRFWYGPYVFGPLWMRTTNLTPEMVERGKRRMHISMIIALLAGMMVATAIMFLGTSLNIRGSLDFLSLSLVLWLGCVVPTALGAILWEQKSIGIVAVNTGYWLVVFMLSSVVVCYEGMGSTLFSMID